MITPHFVPRQPLRAADLNDLAALCREVLAGRLLRGPGYRLLETPEGVIPSFPPTTSSTSPQANFAPTLTDGDDGSLHVHFSPGMVEGLPVTIDGADISAPDENGDTPALIVTPELFAPYGNGLRCLLYLHYFLDADGAVTKVEPLAASSKPPGSPTDFYKLAAILIRQTPDDPARVFPFIVFNQRIVPIHPPSGATRLLPFASG